MDITDVTNTLDPTLSTSLCFVFMVICFKYRPSYWCWMKIRCNDGIVKDVKDFFLSDIILKICWGTMKLEQRKDFFIVIWLLVKLKKDT